MDQKLNVKLHAAKIIEKISLGRIISLGSKLDKELFNSILKV
jgi:hypothetical protein